MYKGEFANDVVLLAWSREAACAAIKVYVEVATSLGLMMTSPRISLWSLVLLCLRRIDNPLLWTMV